MDNKIRIDKWLWAVRIFKTRSIAAEEVSKHHVLVNGQTIKPSRLICAGEEIDVRKPPIIRTYKVLLITENRVSAKLAAEYVADITPAEELERLELLKINSTGVRDRGTGRPTKKERRSLDTFFEN